MTSVGPTRSVEIEVKFDVDASTPLPDLTLLPGVGAIDPADHRSLDARYFDTPQLDLIGRGYALRRRTGGTDAGWHLKGPLVGGGRTETQWPLGETDDVPGDVREELARVSDAPLDVLVPIARIRNERTAIVLRGRGGNPVAEFADDHVIAVDLRTDTERRWREWELELSAGGPADPAEFFAAFAQAARTAGARSAGLGSKLARTLGG